MRVLSLLLTCSPAVPCRRLPLTGQGGGHVTRMDGDFGAPPPHEPPTPEAEEAETRAVKTEGEQEGELSGWELLRAETIAARRRQTAVAPSGGDEEAGAGGERGAEDKNFSLSNCVNELNNEVEKLEEQIAMTRKEMVVQKGQGQAAQSDAGSSTRERERYRGDLV